MGIFDTMGQQAQPNESPNVKFNLVCRVYCVSRPLKLYTVGKLIMTILNG